ncbi:hypothetical protein JW979_00465 [bacterium]|nr:hypothetical protein [candidate division CSSED10-310 bacterium]
MENKVSTSGQTDEISCPSCGRYIGPYTFCPYCQTSIDSRVDIRVIKWIAVSGAIAGLFLLWIGLKYKDIPTIKISDVELTFNMAIVRLEGVIIDISINQKKNSIRFTIDDGTGQAVIYSKLSPLESVYNGNLPIIGNRIAAIGNISISEIYGVTLFLSSPRRFNILEKMTIKDMKIGDLNSSDIGILGRFKAKVVETRTFSTGRSLTLNDASGSIELVFFNSEIAKLSDEKSAKLFSKDFVISIVSRVDEYHGKLQLYPVRPEDPQFLSVIENVEQGNYQKGPE